MAAWRSIRQRAHGALDSRPVKALLMSLLILSLLPIAWAFAFPEPNDRRLCPPNREAPPRLPPESEIQSPASASAPVVKILNPIRGSTATPVSDKYDGLDSRYHITAVASGIPSEAILEAYALLGTSESVLGTLCPIEGTRDTFEGFWDIPETFSEGPADIVVKVFDRAGDGAQVLSADKVAVNMQHRADGAAANESVEMVWPANDGPLGFFRNKLGEWKTNIRGIGSPGSSSGFKAYYSTTPIGGEPSFHLSPDTPCGSVTTTTPRTSDQARPFSVTCKLATGDRPASVTAIAVVAQGGAHSSDAHRVHPFIQRASDMKISIDPVYSINPFVTPPETYPTGRRRVAGQGCLQFVALVTDQFGQAVAGVNVDVELRGPSDSASFGDPVDPYSVPDQSTTTETTRTCSGAVDPGRRQARSIVPDGPDAKAIESTTGTNDNGKWGFRIFSSDPGMARFKVWADDEPLETDTSERVPDDDQHDPGEGFGISEAQWFPAPMLFELTPRDESVSIGACRIYVLEASAGNDAVAGLNVDFHIRVPDPQIRLCGGDDNLKQPDSGHSDGSAHPPDNFGAAVNCPGEGPPCNHFEGVTDADGRLRFGVSSSVAGNSTITAWADGEPGQDTDQPASKATVSIKTNWIADQNDSSIRLLTPSGIVQKASRDTFKIIARVPAPYLVTEVSIEAYQAGIGRVRLGEATRVGNTNIYEFIWDLNRPLKSVEPEPAPSASQAASPSPTPSEAQASPTPMPTATLPGAGTRPGVPDGIYEITARVNGSLSSDTQNIDVNRNISPQTNDSVPPYEWAALTTPRNGDPLGFVNGVTTITGTASATSEGVDFYYSTSAIADKPTWQLCGHFQWAAVAPRSFTGSCRLRGTDKPIQVQGIAAVAFNCAAPHPDCSNPSPTPMTIQGVEPNRSQRGGALGEGEAAAVTGCQGSPCMTMSPTDWQAARGTCAAFSVAVAEQNRPSVGRPVAIEFKGPTDRIRFCNPTDRLDDTWLGQEIVEADPYGLDVHRILGVTDEDGRFDFGVYSEDSNFENIFSIQEGSPSRVTGWLDDGDGHLESGEESVNAEMHWSLEGKCTIIGTSRSEVIFGTSGADKICGLGGNDEIFALEGNDIVLGGLGDDLIHGDEGNDELYGEAGNDSIFGGDGRDLLNGGEDDDHCDLGRGRRQVATECESVVDPSKRRTRRTLSPSRAQ